MKKSKYDYHHIPPRNPARTTPVKLKILKKDHEAYNQLFANAASLSQCVEILMRDWWPNSTLDELTFLQKDRDREPDGSA